MDVRNRITVRDSYGVKGSVITAYGQTLDKLSLNDRGRDGGYGNEHGHQRFHRFVHISMKTFNIHTIECNKLVLTGSLSITFQI